MRVGETIYLDYQASTPVDPRVRAKMLAAEETLFANPHAADHALGWRAAAAISESAQEIAGLIGMDADDLLFTSGASEANAMVIRAAQRIANETGKTELIIGAGDHSSILNEAAVSGLEIRYVPLGRDGSPDLDALSHLISTRTALVSLVGVNNENGAITDLESVNTLCEPAGIPWHADLSQAPLAMDLDLFALGISFATLSSHKVYGPKGVGALIMAPQASRWIEPLIQGGLQQGGRRGGTLPTELCIGFGEACSILRNEGAAERARVAVLRDRFVSKIEAKGIGHLVGKTARRHPGNALIHFAGIEAADLLGRMQPEIAASSQSACASGSVEPSRVVQAMGLSRATASECVRFSFGRFSDIVQIDETIEHLLAILREVRN
ncbi:cysteine desulfurase family protein [Hyphomonas oceanitis]|uniref:Cysteine desulfurase n=1 Tax=Hyphomonas oceanitis SCH89 TaxID=1280953 RepID=A0A059G1L8_9PROT|nr:aminotransferase class V-fold PLP-dependent enzyme [Hyphomonas oceanitis]KDA00711.1 cysteine desulfurase [Hyphomonas oceanitis SCH89]